MRFLERTVDFGASDAALTDEQIARVTGGREADPGHGGHGRAGLQPARTERPLKLSRDVYTDIFAGKIREWDDPRLRRSTRGSTCRSRPSRWSAARTAAAPPMRSATTSARSARNGATAARGRQGRGLARPCHDGARQRRGGLPHQDQPGLDRLRGVRLRQAARTGDGAPAEPGRALRRARCRAAARPPWPRA